MIVGSKLESQPPSYVGATQRRRVLGSYVMGGVGPKGHINTCERYEPLNDTWQTARRMPFPHREGGGGFAIECSGYAVAGGGAIDIDFVELQGHSLSSTLRFMPPDVWCYVQDFIFDTSGGSGAAIGTVGFMSCFGDSTEIVAYKSRADVWLLQLRVLEEPHGSGRMEVMAGRLFGSPFPDPFVWFFTGSTGLITPPGEGQLIEKLLPEFEIMVTSEVEVPNGSHNGQSFQLNDAIYMVGGRVAPFDEFSHVWKFTADPEMLVTMQTLPDPPRENASSFVNTGHGYIVGGDNTGHGEPQPIGGFLDVTDRYDAITDTWSRMAPLAHAMDDGLWGVFPMINEENSDQPRLMPHRRSALGMTI